MVRVKPAVLAIAVAIGVSTVPSASADCMKERSGEVICGGGPCLRDLYGVVYCAQFRFGSVLRTTRGETLCGRGQCVTTIRGEVICSAVEGGGAVRQSDVSVRCQGECEYASLELCERSSAGW